MGQGQFRAAAVETRERPAVQLSQQIFFRGGDDINEFAVQRFFVTERFRIGDRGHGQVDVAPAFASIAAQIGQRVVDDFLTQGIVNLHHLPADFHNRRSRASFRSRRHRCDIRRKQNIKTRRSRARAGRRNVSHHRNRRPQDGLNDGAHRRVEAARRIDGDQNQAGMLGIGAIDSVHDVIRQNRLDLTVDAQLNHIAETWRGSRSWSHRLRIDSTRKNKKGKNCRAHQKPQNAR